MKFESSPLLLLSSVLLLATTSRGFVVMVKSPSVSTATKTTLALSSGTMKRIPDLVAPPNLEDVSKKTRDIYDKNVQNTYGRYPITMVKGKGCTLTSSDGKEYLDFVSGIATCALGHANQELSDAISEQVPEIHHVSNLYYIPVQAALATWLCDNSPADKAFFCNSGAEANEAAIKLARKHAHKNGNTKPVIITARQSFHGRTLATITATGQPKYHKGFGFGKSGEMIPGFEYVTYNDANELQELIDAIQNDPENRGQLAAIMLEAIQGEGGVVKGEYEFFKTARDLCDKHNALLMLDEVQVGMGRTGSLWGFQQLGSASDDIVPDVFTSAKALGGGVPIGAMCARGAAATVFGPGDHSSTYGGNPLACRAALAVAGYMTKHNVLQNVQDRGEQLSAGLERIANKFPTVLNTEIRGRGLMRGVQCLDSGVTAGQVVSAAMEEGLLLVPAGADVTRFVPPLIVTEAQVDQALEMFEKAVTKLATADNAAQKKKLVNIQKN